MILRSTVLLLALAAGAAAQSSAGRTFFQNSDVAFLYGLSSVPSEPIDGTGFTVRGATRGPDVSLTEGYQLFRFSGASFWAQYSYTSAGPSSLGVGAAGSVDESFDSYTLGGRLRIPLASRILISGAVSGGGGDFHYPTIANGLAASHSTWHGVIETSGSVDFRIVRFISFRIEARDLISGHGLSGSSSPNHFVPMVGLAFHQ